MSIKNYLTSMAENKITTEVTNMVTSSFMTTIVNPDQEFIYGVLIYLCTYTPNYMRKIHPSVYNEISKAIECSCNSDTAIRGSVKAHIRSAWHNSIPCKIVVVIHGTLISMEVTVPQSRDGDCSSVSVTVSIVGPFHMSVIDDIKKISSWAGNLNDAKQVGATYLNGVTDIVMCNASSKRDLPGRFQASDECSSIICKTMESIFFKDKESLISSLDKFQNNFNRYVSSGIRKSYGVLLYGDPGTGKSTIAAGIAARYSNYLIKISWGGLEVNELEDLIRASCSNSGVVLFDDCDSMMDVKDTNGNLIYRDILLRTLDGVYCNGISPVIFVLTTNFIDKIDDAIKRPGRIDFISHVGNIHTRDANEMCKYFHLSGLEELIEILREKNPEALPRLEKLDDEGVNPSWLQSTIVEAI